MQHSAPSTVEDHRVEGGGGHGQQGGDEAVLAQQPQTSRSSSSSVSTPSSSSSGQAESKPAPKKRKTWKRQHLGTSTHAREGLGIAEGHSEGGPTAVVWFRFGAGMAISPQRRRTWPSASRRRPESSHGWPVVGRCPPPRDGGGWPLVGRCPPPRDGGGSGRLPWRSAQACGVAFIAAESRVQHALAVCRHTRACVRVRPVAEARP